MYLLEPDICKCGSIPAGTGQEWHGVPRPISDFITSSRSPYSLIGDLNRTVFRTRRCTHMEIIADL